MPRASSTASRSLAEVVEYLSGIGDATERQAARAALKQQALASRLRGRRSQTGAKVGDAIAKFGSGSLLTATLLLIIAGQTAPAILTTAAMALFLFVAGTTFLIYNDLKASALEFEAEWLEAALKEAER